jgi:hypothetical protein
MNERAVPESLGPNHRPRMNLYSVASAAAPTIVITSRIIHSLAMRPAVARLELAAESSRPFKGKKTLSLKALCQNSDVAIYVPQTSIVRAEVGTSSHERNQERKKTIHIGFVGPRLAITSYVTLDPGQAA